MRRAARLSLWALAAIVVLPLVLATLLVAIANTDPGRRAIERAVAQASGGQVVLEGLAGRFPDRLRIARIETRDRDGTWGVATDLALDWSPGRLLRGEAHVARVELARLALHRLPLAENQASAPAPPRKASARLPVRVAVEALHVGRLELAPPLAGVAAALEIGGRARLASASQFDLGLRINRLDAPGRYQLEGSADASRLVANLDLAEPAGGLLARLGSLPELGAVSLKGSIDGPRNAERVQLAAAAGPAHGTVQGTIDLEGRVLDLQVVAGAPAMRPSESVAWQSVTLQGYVKGPYTTPEANLSLRVRGVRAGEAGLQNLEADLAGRAGAMALHAIAEGLRLPGARPDLFAGAPLSLQAQARLDDPARPVDFSLRHSLLAVEGHANAAGDPSGTANVTIPALAPIAAAAGMQLDGRTTIALRADTKGDVTRVDIDGAMAVTGGAAPLPALIGSNAKLTLSATLRADALTVERAQLDGRTLHLSASGTRRGEAFNVTWHAAVSDLAALAPTLRGALSAEGKARGTPRDISVGTDARARVGTRDFPPEPIEAHLSASGALAAPSGALHASGRLLGAPLELAAKLRHERDGTLRVAIDRADWKSAHADGQVTVPGADRVPRGQIALRVTRLDDLQALIGQPLQGSVVARLAFVPQARPSVALQLVADGIVAQGFTGNARIDANGPQDAVTINVSSRLKDRDGSEARLAGAGEINAGAHTARVDALALHYRGQSARLLQRATFNFADGIAVDRLRVGVQEAVLEVAGRLSPTLDLRASLRNVTPALLKLRLPHLDAVGMLNAQAKLAGSPARPRGNVRLDLTGLRLRSGPARTLPAANLRATADLEGQAAQVRARLDAGPRVQLALNGTAPLAASERMNLRATGKLDLALANPLLEADGRRAQGRVTIDVGVTGGYGAPHAEGSVTIARGDLQDVARGARVHDLAALLRLDGDVLRIARFSGRAGRGTITASGEVGVLQPDLPVDITLAARDARPLASDLVTADLDLDLRLRGAARTRMDAVGRVHVKHADINIPGELSSSVAVLDVRRPGQEPPPPSEAAPLVVGLDIGVDAPRAVFVRGRGLDAEMGGSLRVGGTAAAPEISGGFDLRRGTFNFAGANLKFTRGRVGFSGTGLQRKLDPTLDFAAETAAGDVTAKLGVTGFASAPKIALSSTPELPQDEVLARLLFGVSVKELSPLQMVQIARAVATLKGAGGGKPGPLEMAQKRLGLDRLSVSGGEGNSGPTVEAGRYISERVYVGARQSGAGATQTRVQVDLTRKLKLEARVGSGGGTLQGATPDNDPGTSLGLLYQKEY
jgi:translocation and assembly module TamB